MDGLIRRAVLVIVAAGLWAVAGCSGDDGGEPATGDEPSVDEVASSWGEIPRRDEARTRAYLGGAGRPLMEYAGFAAGLPERLDDAAYADGCADLRAEWRRSYAGRRMINRLYALPDPILGRLLTSQIPTIERLLAACEAGDRNAGAELADRTVALQELVDRRLDQLEVER